MTIKFNNEKNFPIIMANEIYHFANNSTNFFVQVIYTETVQQELINYLKNNKLNIIQIYDDLNNKIYETTKYLHCDQVNRSINNNNKFIQLEFME